MIDDYIEKFYLKLAKRSGILKEIILKKPKKLQPGKKKWLLVGMLSKF